MPAVRSASMLLTARLTTEVAIWANSTPSDVAISTRRGFVSVAVEFENMVTLITSFLASGSVSSSGAHRARQRGGLVRFRSREWKRMFVVKSIITADRAAYGFIDHRS